MDSRDTSTSNLSAMDLQNVTSWSNVLEGNDVTTTPRLTIEMRDGSSRVTKSDMETEEFLLAMDAHLELI